MTRAFLFGACSTALTRRPRLRDGLAGHGLRTGPVLLWRLSYLSNKFGQVGVGFAKQVREWRATAEIYADPAEAERRLRQALREANEGKATPWQLDDVST